MRILTLLRTWLFGAQVTILNKEEAEKELGRIKELLKPSSLVPLSEVLSALYNFNKAFPVAWEQDLKALKGHHIKMHSKTSLRLAQLVSEAFDSPYQRVSAFYSVFDETRKEMAILDWYSDKESVIDVLELMPVWCRIGTRVHYERFQDGPQGDYDKPVNRHQTDFVFSNMFMKVINDYIELLQLLVRNQS